jgi:type IV pilus biogenesis protein CpaD/CtpE
MTDVLGLVAGAGAVVARALSRALVGAVAGCTVSNKDQTRSSPEGREDGQWMTLADGSMLCVIDFGRRVSGKAQ